MNANAITSLVALASLLGGAFAGTRLRASLPADHLGEHSKNVVLLGTGLVVTMAALVLGLLVSSAYSSFDAQRVELTEMAAKMVLLDRVLAQHGPEAKQARNQLGVWSHVVARLASEQNEAPSVAAEELYGAILKLDARDDAQRDTRSEALRLLGELRQTRWLMYAQRQTSLPRPLLVLLIAWLTIIYVSFGLFAPTNMTVAASLFVSALSVAGADSGQRERGDRRIVIAEIGHRDRSEATLAGSLVGLGALLPSGGAL